MKKHIHWIVAVVLIAIAIFPLVAFFAPGLPNGHDAQDHVVRIANFYQALTEGVWIPRWGVNLNWGYGHPVLMFLYPCSSYLASLFHFLGFSFVNSTKAVFVVAYIGSMLSMYLWVNAVWGKRAGVIAAILYGFAPYRFVDMYVRMAIGEHMAFVFPPLVMYFLYKLSLSKNQELRTKNYYGIGLSFSFALLILSHNAIALMFLPIIGLYTIYLFFTEGKRSVFYLLSLIFYLFIGFGLSAFFWLPAFFEGKYTLRNIVTAGGMAERFVPAGSFFYSPWNYGLSDTLTKEIGIAQWLGILASFVVILKTKDKKLRLLLVGTCVFFLIALFIMTSASGWIWERVMILQNFQFPFRFLSLTTFLAAVLGGISVNQLLDMFGQKIKNKKQQGLSVLILLIVFCLLPIVSTYYMWHPKGYQIEPESFYTRVYPGTTDTGESTPIWTTRFQEQYPKAPLEVISGRADITFGKRTSTIHEYSVDAQERAELMENTLYFPGWTVFIDGTAIPVEFQSMLHRGIMTFWIDPGTHDVRVELRDTKVRSMANGITVISIFLVIISIPVCVLWKKRT